jgi:hypothetical protein
MKKWLILVSVMLLVLLISVNTLGAIQHLGDGSATIGRWYSVAPDTPYFIGSFYNINQGWSAAQDLTFEFFKNDQTFFNYINTKAGSLSASGISGSFLTESGFFIGAGVTRREDYYSYAQRITISPGFRAAIDENSYLAVSLDWVTDGYWSKINAYEISGKLFAEGFKITGDSIFYPDSEQLTASLEGDLVLSEQVVAGFDTVYSSAIHAIDYDAGFTYTGDTLTIDAQTGYTNQYTDYFYSVNGVFNVSEVLHFGAGYTKYNRDRNGLLILKAQFGNDHSKFVLKYNSANYNYYETLSLAFEHKFKN